MNTNAASTIDSNVDTILTLPERTRSVAVASACRESALAFINESEHWGKAELAMWLMGPYAQLTQYGAPYSDRLGQPGRAPLPMLREIDARMVDRVIKSARSEILETLRRSDEEQGGPSFAFAMLASGFVVRCEDRAGSVGWVPTTDARRLADRVLSLFAVDYLTRPMDYELQLSICHHCESVMFDEIARMRGICHQHGSGVFVPGQGRSTLPYMPEGA